MRSLGRSDLRIWRSGTSMTIRGLNVHFSLRSSLRRRLSVKTTPPSREAAASSKAPVTDTPASMERSAFRRSTSRWPHLLPQGVQRGHYDGVGRGAAALQPPGHRYLGTGADHGLHLGGRNVQHRSNTASRPVWSVLRRSLRCGPHALSGSISSTSAQVFRSMPNAQPLPGGDGVDDGDGAHAPLPFRFKAAPPGRPSP